MTEHDCTKCVHARKYGDHEWECNAEEYDLENFSCFVPVLMTFGDAIEYLKAGKKVARKGWNGKGMYLWLKPACVVKREWCRDPYLLDCIDANGGEEIAALGTVCMYTHDSTGRKAALTGWLASQSDILSEDWYIVD